MLADQGSSEPLTPEVGQRLLDDLPVANFLVNKSKKVATTRWGTWHDDVEELLREYRSKLFVLLCLGLLHGWSGKDMLGTDAVQRLSRHRNTIVGLGRESGAAASDEQPKENMRMANEKMRRARDGCKNALAAAAKTLSSPGFHFDLSCISLTTAPLRRWHGMMAKTVRHGCVARTFYAKEATFGDDSGLRNVILDMLNPFDHRDAIERLGFITTVMGCYLQKMELDHVDVIAEQHRAQRVWRLQLKVVRSTLMHFGYLRNYPCKFAKLLVVGAGRQAILEDTLLVLRNVHSFLCNIGFLFLGFFCIDSRDNGVQGPYFAGRVLTTDYHNI